MHAHVDLTFKNLQFCFPSDKQAHIFLVGGRKSRLTAGSNIIDPMIKINSYMGENIWNLTLAQSLHCYMQGL